MPHTFLDIWSSMTAEAKADLVRRSKVPYTYLSAIANGKARAGASVIQRLMAADNRITFDMMRAEKQAS